MGQTRDHDRAARLAALVASTPPRKRSVLVAGHPTSVTLEDVFWRALHGFAGAGSVNALVTEIDNRRSGPLSRAIRLHVLDRLRRG